MGWSRFQVSASVHSAAPFQRIVCLQVVRQLQKGILEDLERRQEPGNTSHICWKGMTPLIAVGNQPVWYRGNGVHGREQQAVIFFRVAIASNQPQGIYHLTPPLLELPSRLSKLRMKEPACHHLESFHAQPPDATSLQVKGSGTDDPADHAVNSAADPALQGATRERGVRQGLCLGGPARKGR